jgi:DNA-binding NtrC family response regulator
MVPQAPPTHMRSPKPKQRELSILIVDDDEMLLRTIQHMLTERGHTVVTCEDAHKGIVALKKGKFDVMITDVVMPDAKGTALAEIARVKFPDLPIIVISADSHNEGAWNGHGTKGTAFVLKPFKFELLLKTIFEVVQ